MISDGIGGIIFSKNIAKHIVRYAIIEFFSTAKLMYSGIVVRKFTRIIVKPSIYIVQVYKDHQQKH